MTKNFFFKKHITPHIIDIKKENKVYGNDKYYDDVGTNSTSIQEVCDFFDEKFHEKISGEYARTLLNRIRLLGGGIRRKKRKTMKGKRRSKQKRRTRNTMI